MLYRKIKITGQKSIHANIPQSWSEVTYKQFLEVKDEKDPIKRVSILTDIPVEFFQYKEMVDFYIWLEEKLIWSNKYEEEDSSGEFFRIDDYNFHFPKDINLKSIGLYWDIQSEAQESDKDVLKIFPFICAGYLQLELDTEYDYGKAKEYEKYFMSQPCNKVLNCGNFFLSKVNKLKNGTGQIQSSLITLLTKYLQGTISWLKSSVKKQFYHN